MKSQGEIIRTIIAGSREFIDQHRLNKVCNWIFAYKKIAYSDVEIISGTWLQLFFLCKQTPPLLQIPYQIKNKGGNNMKFYHETSIASTYTDISIERRFEL